MSPRFPSSWHRLDEGKEIPEPPSAHRDLSTQSMVALAKVRYPERTFVLVNPAFLQLLGYEHAQEILGQKTQVICPDDAESQGVNAIAQETLEKGNGYLKDVVLRRKDGQPIYADIFGNRVDEPDRPLEIVWTIVDVSDRHHLVEDLYRQSTTDPLTGLANRRGLDLELERAFARARRQQRLLAVCVLDLDGFKPVNDTFGHEAGDQVLIALGKRLPEALRATDFVARLGGDEFVVLIESLEHLHALETILGRMETSIRAPIALGEERTVTVGVSIGVALYFPDEHDDQQIADTLLRLADQALYEAKLHKDDRERCWVLFGEDPHPGRNVIQNLLDQDTLEVWYQPILDYKRHRIVGVEALARLRDSDGTLLSPAQFLPALEPGDLTMLSEKVLEHALNDLKELETIGQTLWASVNVDPRSISESCVLCVQDQITAAGIDPTRITLEILEGSDFSDQKEALDYLQGLKNLHIRIALDDVGSAYSSLLRIKQVPIDEIKLDQGFVRTLEEHPEELVFVRTMRELAQGLGVDLVVEGVETEDILDALAVLGVRLMQGYGIARPMPLEALKAFLKQPIVPHRAGPRSLLGLYAEHLILHDTLKKTILDSRGSLGYLPIADHERCVLHQHLQRLRPPNLGRLEKLHAEYHRQLAAVAASSLENWTQIEELSETIKQEIVSAYFAVR